jgi:hypothetical protein
MENHIRNLFPLINAIFELLEFLAVRIALLILLVVGAWALITRHRQQTPAFDLPDSRPTKRSRVPRSRRAGKRKGRVPPVRR